MGGAAKYRCCLVVVCRIGNLASAMKKSEDLHDII
jgi:hypothetical protein